VHLSEVRQLGEQCRKAGPAGTEGMGKKVAQQIQLRLGPQGRTERSALQGRARLRAQHRPVESRRKKVRPRLKHLVQQFQFQLGPEGMAWQRLMLAVVECAVLGAAELLVGFGQ
jgi:hypothetical protein